MRRRDLMLLLAAALVPMPAEAADHAVIARHILGGFVIPRYELLAESAARQASAWSKFCAAPAPQGIAELRTLYLSAADAWSGIEFLRYGPVADNFRIERLSYWPERKNATSRGLTALLAGSEPITPARIAAASVAVQGLPAIERLLFDENSADLLVKEPRRCAAGLAIATNIATLATEIVAAWKGLAPTLDVKEFTTRFVTDLLSLLEIIRDQKLRAVLGADAASAKPRLAEGWRSQRSLHAIALNLDAIDAASQLIYKAAQTKGVVVPGAIASARDIINGLAGDLGTLATNPTTRWKLYLLLDAIKATRDFALDEIPAAVGITLGFNSLDGD